MYISNTFISPVNSLTFDPKNPDKELQFRWDLIITLAFFTFLKGGGTGM